MEHQTFEATYPAHSFAPLITMAVAVAGMLARKPARSALALETAAINPAR